MTAIKYAANKTLNTLLNVKIRQISVDIGQSNLFEYGKKPLHIVITLFINENMFTLLKVVLALSMKISIA